jgi:hypothetical protein
MSQRRAAARADLRRMMTAIFAIAALMVAGALWYTSLFLPLTIVVVSATVGGVFLSVVLGCGLFALAFYSDKSGHDEAARDATERAAGRRG